MTQPLIRLLERLLLPPGGILLLLLVALWLAHSEDGRMRRIGLGLGVGAALLLYLSATPFIARVLTLGLENSDRYPALSAQEIRNTPAQAIVILGYGRYSEAPEYDGADTLSLGGLARVRYGARLHRLTGLPVLVAGGRAFPHQPSEAAIMKQVLEQEFGVPVRWMDEKSRNTWENARNATAILQRAGIGHVLMVTHSRDTRRALWSFAQAGALRVTPAPTLLSGRGGAMDFMDWVPAAYAVKATGMALHEWIGQFWYFVRHG